MCGSKCVSEISFIVKHLLNNVVKLSTENEIFRKILYLFVFNQWHNRKIGLLHYCKIEDKTMQYFLMIKLKTYIGLCFFYVYCRRRKSRILFSSKLLMENVGLGKILSLFHSHNFLSLSTNAKIHFIYITKFKSCCFHIHINKVLQISFQGLSAE